MQGVLNGFNGAQITNYSAAIKGLNLNQAQLLLTTQGLNAERSKEILIEAGLLASENAIQAELLESALIKAGLGKEEREEILRKLGLIAVQGEEAIVQGTCTAEDLRATLAQKLKNEADVEGIMTTLGLAGANKTATASVGLLTKSIWANIKAMAAWMVSNPLGWLMLAGVAIAGVAGFVDLFTTSVKEHEENLENLKSEYSEIKSELEGLNNELKTTQDRIAELESKDVSTFFNYINFDVDGKPLEIATTRPELLPAIVCVFVNPSDEAHNHLIGKTAHIPVIDVEVPIMADEKVAEDKGTGFVSYHMS